MRLRWIRYLAVWAGWVALVVALGSRWLVARLDGSGPRSFVFGLSVVGNPYLVLPTFVAAVILGPWLTNRYFDRRGTRDAVSRQ